MKPSESNYFSSCHTRTTSCIHCNLFFKVMFYIISYKFASCRSCGKALFTAMQRVSGRCAGSCITVVVRCSTTVGLGLGLGTFYHLGTSVENTIWTWTSRPWFTFLLVCPANMHFLVCQLISSLSSFHHLLWNGLWTASVLNIWLYQGVLKLAQC